jgi:AmmeMemoRadiSam system protein B/AmmeMemoRadiSam system protein A
MRAILLSIILMLPIMKCSSQEISKERQPYAAGRFYTSDRKELVAELDALFDECLKVEAPGLARAIIVPHAGYVYSGSVAASAFATTPKKGSYKNIFIIGSTHVMGFSGASVYESKDYVTPLGVAATNRMITNKLKESTLFTFPEHFHDNDHVIEVVIPFIQSYYEDNPQIIPIIIGTDDRNTIKKMAETLRPWFTSENLFVISSDFSHYPYYDDAVVVDNLTAEALMSANPDQFLKVLRNNSSKRIPGLATSMCGWSSGLLLLDMIQGSPGLDFKKINYQNSGDSRYGDKSGVVGYNAIGLYEKGDLFDSELSFTDKEKEELFRIARLSIESWLNNRRYPTIDGSGIDQKLKEKYGAFVTLKIDGVLRGCIGKFVSDDPLYKAVSESAISSAFSDPRFPQLTKDEYPNIDIEITVLGPMKRIYDKNEIVLGRHGVYIRQGSMAGTLLPQVAIENGWDVDEFLEYTSQYKAGIGRSGWKRAELYIYEGVVFEEKR